MCPWNSPKLVHVTTERDYPPDWREAGDRPEAPGDLPGTESPPLVDLMRMTREEWDKRNVAVAIGNWLADLDEPPDEAVAVLRDALEDQEALVREHAAWALERCEARRS